MRPRQCCVNGGEASSVAVDRDGRVLKFVVRGMERL